MKRHTPGPWIKQNGLQIWKDGATTVTSPRICTIKNAADPVDQLTESEQEANANLIAAAPDLLTGAMDVLLASEADDHDSLMNAIEALHAITNQARGR